MSNMGTLNGTTTSTSSDDYLVRQGGIDYKQSREQMAAALNNARWNAQANYITGTKVVASDGLEYTAQQGSGVDTGGAVDPVSDTDNSHWLSSLEVLARYSLRYRVGQKAEIHSSQIPDWLLKADGSVVSRTVDDVLWTHASTSGLIIAQATKDANPEQYAMYYGDGDGSTTFSLPNWYLGHFARGNPSGVSLGETQDSQNKEHTHGVTGYGQLAKVSGGTIGNIWDGTANTVTAPSGGGEARPKTGNINICIERGKIPA